MSGTKWEGQKVVALAGNPNVGKSTVFNALTGMNQHTGNWPGKTVASARGRCLLPEGECLLVDLPGTYSLLAHSAEEEIARSFVCFEQPDCVVVVCDGTALERNLNLVLQILEITDRAVVCVNLMDEAGRKHIELDLELLSQRLGVPVVGTAARDKATLWALKRAVARVCAGERGEEHPLTYPAPIEEELAVLTPFLRGKTALPERWLGLRLLEGEESFLEELGRQLGSGFFEDEALAGAVARSRAAMEEAGLDRSALQDRIVETLVGRAEEICRGAVTCRDRTFDAFDRRLDRILTSPLTGYPVMLLLLAGVFWLTITGANYPSRLLSEFLFWGEGLLEKLFVWLRAPEWLSGMLVHGVYRVLAWVVSVMLPPMAIFFPLFTLLEDAGYLPRVAYNLDHCFHRCHACGKQALTMCMGFGCNAAGVIGCRIIDSPRERLLAVLTNSFVPCNGRFPTFIALITMFFVGETGLGALYSSLLLTGMVLLGVGATLLATRFLSVTLLKGLPSSFTLELPPYRRPQFGKVLVRSVFDRTLFVLGRAAAVAAPAGLLIWLLANVTVGGVSILHHCAALLDPLGRLMGLDGVILLGFLLGLPANEIVLPIITMTYLSQGTLIELDSLVHLRALFVENGWTWMTAASAMLFSLMHSPCATTLLTIRKETGSRRWTALAALLPTAAGVVLCILFHGVTTFIFR